MKFGFEYVLMISLSVECFCIGPDWNNHPIMQQTIEEKVEPYTTAFLNITYVNRVTGELVSEKSDLGKFGDAHESVVSGVLIHVRSKYDTANEDPFTGCGFPLKASYGWLPMNEPWIALVKRGGCSFQQKMENAYKSNASGFIVYNDKESTTLEKMKLQHNIPSKYCYYYY